MFDNNFNQLKHKTEQLKLSKDKTVGHYEYRSLVTKDGTTFIVVIAVLYILEMKEQIEHQSAELQRQEAVFVEYEMNEETRKRKMEQELNKIRKKMRENGKNKF